MYIGALVCCTLIVGTAALIAFDEEENLAHVTVDCVVYEVPLSSLSQLESE